MAASLIRIAAAGAALTVGQQVLGKALRDAWFLAHHPPSALPLAFAISAVAAVGLALGLGRAIQRSGARRVLPVGWLVYALLAAAALAAAPRSPAAAYLLHVLVAAGGVALSSGFWLQLGEGLDPRAARRSIAGIGAAGAAGGLVAGAVTWGAAPSPAVPAGLFVTLLLAGAALAARLPAAAPRDVAAPPVARFGTPYLRRIAALVLLVSAAATLLDWRFKDALAAADPGSRLPAFGAFHGVTAGLVLAAQVAVTGPVLARAGLTRVLLLLPAGLALGALAAAVRPTLAAVTAARAIEVVLRGSAFRSAYELLFAPLPPATRRGVRGALDVGADRAGDVAGAALAAALIGLGLAAGPGPWIAAAALGLAALGVALDLGRRHQRELALGLARGAAAGAAPDAATSLVGPPETLGLSLVLPAAPAPAPVAAAPDDRALRLIASSDPLRVRFALAGREPLGPAAAAAAIPLLARDDVAADALRALRRAAGAGVVEPLARALADDAVPDVVRRRLPRALLAAPPAAAVPALLAGLADPRFEVRIACGRALHAVRDAHPAAPIAGAALVAAVLAEAARGRAVWGLSLRLDDDDSGTSPFGGAVRDRAARGLEHCFTLLALLLPGEPLRLAWRALHGGDPARRGTALEYLDGALPPPLREALWPHLEPEAGPRRPPRPLDQVLAELRQAHPSLAIELKDAPPPR